MPPAPRRGRARLQPVAHPLAGVRDQGRQRPSSLAPQRRRPGGHRLWSSLRAKPGCAPGRRLMVSMGSLVTPDTAASSATPGPGCSCSLIVAGLAGDNRPQSRPPASPPRQQRAYELRPARCGGPRPTATHRRMSSAAVKPGSTGGARGFPVAPGQVRRACACATRRRPNRAKPRGQLHDRLHGRMACSANRRACNRGGPVQPAAPAVLQARQPYGRTRFASRPHQPGTPLFHGWICADGDDALGPAKKPSASLPDRLAWLHDCARNAVHSSATAPLRLTQSRQGRCVAAALAGDARTSVLPHVAGERRVHQVNWRRGGGQQAQLWRSKAELLLPGRRFSITFAGPAPRSPCTRGSWWPQSELSVVITLAPDSGSEGRPHHTWLYAVGHAGRYRCTVWPARALMPTQSPGGCRGPGVMRMDVEPVLVPLAVGRAPRLRAHVVTATGCARWSAAAGAAGDLLVAGARTGDEEAALAAHEICPRA